MILLNALILVVIDAVWLLAIRKPYAAAVAKIQGSPAQFRPIYAAPVYLALAYLLTLPKSLTQAFLVGLCTYAVYDFTLLVVLKDYPLKLALMDTVWGGVLMMSAFYVKLKLKRGV